MYAIEFQAKIKNGLIKIPKKYWKRLGLQEGKENVRVIVLSDQSEDFSGEVANKDMIEQLLLNPLQIPDFRPLGRDNLYDRS